MALEHILILFLLVNYVRPEDAKITTSFASKDIPDEFGEQAPLSLEEKLHQLSDGESSNVVAKPVRQKRQLHEGTMHITASRDRGVHWGYGGGGSGNRGSSKSRNSNGQGVVNAQKAQAVLGEVTSLCLVGDALAPGKTPAPVFSVAGVGSLTLTGTVGDSMIAGFTSALGKLATVGKRLLSTSPMGVLVASISYIPSVGVDSDKVRGRMPENFISVSVPARVMNLPDKETLRRAAKETGVVNLPIRGEIVTEKNVDVRVVRTPTVRPVKVVAAVRDENTGLFSAPLTNSVVPGGKLVTTPPTVPNVQGQRPLVNPIADTPVRVHTGDVGGLRSTLVKPFPASEAAENKDIVLVYPDNSGLEPVYVMYNKPRKGVSDADHKYHPAPKTEDIAGFPGLIPQRRKTPVQGGGGLRARWKDPKGRTIYEWDSEKGELEGYRASDGQHVGSFDPKTGEQRDQAKPKRKIRI